MNRSNLHSLIVDHLQSQIPQNSTQQSQYKQTIESLKKIWGLKNEDISKVKTEYGSLLDRLQYLDDMIPYVRQLAYMCAEDMQHKDIHTTFLKIDLAKQYMPEDPILFCNSAAILYRYGLYQYSAYESLNAIYLDPLYLKAYIRLGLACWALGKPKLAMIAYKKGLEISPGNQIILHNIEVLNNKKAKPPNPIVTLNESPTLNITMPSATIIDGVDFAQELCLNNPELADSNTSHEWTSADLLERLNSPEMQELMGDVDVDEMSDILNRTTYSEDEKMKKILSAMLKLH